MRRLTSLASATVTFANSCRRWLQPSRSTPKTPLNPGLCRPVETIRTLDEAPTPRPVPKEAPLAIVTDPWRPYVKPGRPSRRYYELCTLWQLRSALRAGDIWVAHSRRYADPATYLIPSTAVAAPAG